MTENTTSPRAKELVISRTFDAPRPLVWKAWTESERLAQWWGPPGCKLRVEKLDFRPGGLFIYAMEFQPGQSMWGRFVYREITPPERLVFVNSFSDANGGITRAPFSATWPLEVLNILTLTEENKKTRLELRGGPINVTAEEQKTFDDMNSSLQQGFTGTFDQLEAYLSKAAE
jgi:uncharacterized protein YndB with AHSA1/START domain